MDRYYEQERYIDALARGRRLLEGMVFYSYDEHYGADVRRMVEKWRRRLPENLAHKFQSHSEGYVALLFLARALIEAHPHPDPMVRALVLLARLRNLWTCVINRLRPMACGLSPAWM